MGNCSGAKKTPSEFVHPRICNSPKKARISEHLYQHQKKELAKRAIGGKGLNLSNGKVQNSGEEKTLSHE